MSEYFWNANISCCIPFILPPPQFSLSLLLIIRGVIQFRKQIGHCIYIPEQKISAFRKSIQYVCMQSWSSTLLFLSYIKIKNQSLERLNYLDRSSIWSFLCQSQMGTYIYSLLYAISSFTDYSGTFRYHSKKTSWELHTLMWF